MYEWAEFRHLKYLLAILELESFRAAAEQLHTTQPNLSVQAKSFQENADVRLYHKGRDGRIQPTETGVAFQVMARALLEARDEAMVALIAIDRGELVSIRFGCSATVDEALFSGLCQLHKEIAPRCAIWPERADTQRLLDDVLNGSVNAALITLPAEDDRLTTVKLRSDRLVVCLRKDHVLAQKAALSLHDLEANLRILYQAERHPKAHARLLGLFEVAGLQLADYSRASHPTEMQSLVRDGYGFALLREGTPLEPSLTTRPIAGVDWMVDTALIFLADGHPKTVPVMARNLKRSIENEQTRPSGLGRKRLKTDNERTPVQLPLLRWRP